MVRVPRIRRRYRDTSCRDNRGCSLPLFAPRLSRGGRGERKWSRSLKLSSGGENWRKIPLVLVPKSTPEFRRFNSWHLSPHVLSVLSTQLSFSPLRKWNKTRGCWTLESKRLSRLIKISSSSSLDQSLILRRWYMHRHNVVINHVINVLCN